MKVVGQTVQPGELGHTDERRTLPSALSPGFAKATLSIIIRIIGIKIDDVSYQV